MHCIYLHRQYSLHLKNQLKSIYIKEGVRGLFRGIFPSVMQVAPLTAIQFWSYNVVLEALKDYTKKT